MRQADEEQYPAKGKGRKKPPLVAGATFYTFHPNAEQRMELNDLAYDLPWALDIISSRLAEDCRLVLGYKPENGAFYAMVKETTVDWDKARNVWVWHRDLSRAMIGLAFYLTHVNPEWPQGPVQLSFIEAEW